MQSSSFGWIRREVMNRMVEVRGWRMKLTFGLGEWLNSEAGRSQHEARWSRQSLVGKDR
jgi:hypothetical protein